MDFNNSDNQQNFDVIPNGILAKVRMAIKPGGYDDQSQGWNGGYATKNPATGSIYLSCEFVVTEGEFARRRIWSLIGLHSEKGQDWANIGRSFIKAILNSARGVSETDTSLKAQNARKINGLNDLDGIEFIAKISTTKDQSGNPKNEIKFAITPDHKEYARLMGNISSNNVTQNKSAGNNRPTWAQ